MTTMNVEKIQESMATAKKAIDEVINTPNLANEVMNEAVQAQDHLTKVTAIVSGKQTDEPSMTEGFMKANEALQTLKDCISDEYAAAEDVDLLPELDAANYLIADAIELVERARMRAEGTLKGKQTARVFLTTMGEYFTFDPTTPKLRYTGIPKEYRH